MFNISLFFSSSIPGADASSDSDGVMEVGGLFDDGDLGLMAQPPSQTPSKSWFKEDLCSRLSLINLDAMTGLALKLRR